MRRGFGRRRWRNEETRTQPIDPAWLARASESGALPVPTLERVEFDDVPADFALTAQGSAESGARWAVGVAPGSGGDALLAALVAAARIEAPRVAAVCRSWDSASRRRLSVVGGLAGPPLACVVGGEEAAPVVAEGPGIDMLPPERVGAQLSRAAERALFARALLALRGLAAKHGGAVRGAGRAAELVILARRTARLRPDGDGLVLETLLPKRDLQRLSADSLVEAFDRLEGMVRKRSNDRHIRDGEEGLRGRALGALEVAADLRFSVRWPLGGDEPDTVDLVGVAADGTPVVAAVRERLTLPVLGEVLDAVLRLDPWLPALLEEAEAPVRVATPRVVLASTEWQPAVEAACGYLTLDIERWDLAERGGRVLLSVREGAPVPAPRTEALETPPSLEPPEALERSEAERVEAGSGEAEWVGTEEPRSAGRRRRSRGRRRGGARTTVASEGPSAGEEPPAARFEEVSFFDLEDEEPSAGEGDAGPRRRRSGRAGRGRRRGPGERAARTSDDQAEEGEAEDEEGEATRPGAARARRRGRGRRRGDERAAPAEGDEREEELDEELLTLSPDAPDFDEAVLPAYEEEEEEESGPESEAERIRLEREKRRLARLAKTEPAPSEPEGETEEQRSLPRGRAAIVTRNDRTSILAAVLLAREWRQLEGIWIYPREELMTFFRGVATDLRENAPIFVVGLEAHPARDVIQAASLYRDRLVWFDHHEWPPEDSGALAEAVGSYHLHLIPGAGSVLPAVVSFCSRRSRFSDKLVDLVTGRFTQHDFQRWGRLWWWRLGELAGQTGERRADLDPLIVGRPSDLTREASRVQPPPVPEELEFARSRDFRVVHFGGLGIAVVEAPPALDPFLTARIVRERYSVALSLARGEGSSLFVLAADDVAARRALDVEGMVGHLAEKFDWVRAMPDADHVARFRADGLVDHPERLDDLIAEIGMGRTVLEG